MYVEESNVYKLPKIPNLKDNSNTPRSKIRYDILRISQEKSRENNKKKNSNKFLTVPWTYKSIKSSNNESIWKIKNNCK